MPAAVRTGVLGCDDIENVPLTAKERVEAGAMEFEVGQLVEMKKPHPCGENRWEILRVGMDFRLRCMGCGRQVMVPRKVVEKKAKRTSPLKGES